MNEQEDKVSMVDTDAQKIAALKREVAQYQEAYEGWKANGQALHTALLTVWRALTPDSEHMTFSTPQQAEDDILAALRLRSGDEDVYVIFDGPPSHESGRFVECENAAGQGVNAGEWIKRADGMWALRIRRSGQAVTQ